MSAPMPTGAHMIPAAKAIAANARERADRHKSEGEDVEADEALGFAEVVDCLGRCIENEARRATVAHAVLKRVQWLAERQTHWPPHRSAIIGQQIEKLARRALEGVDG